MSNSTHSKNKFFSVFTSVCQISLDKDVFIEDAIRTSTFLLSRQCQLCIKYTDECPGALRSDGRTPRKYLTFKRNIITKMRIEIHVQKYCFKLYNVHIGRRL